MHERERSDQRHRHGEGRNQRGAPALEEDEDHENDEDNRLEKRLHHFTDRLPHDCRGVKGNCILQARRKGPAQTQELRLDAIANIEGVGGGKSDDREAERIEALKPQR